MNRIQTFPLGALSGALTAASVFLQIGQLPGFTVFGACVGMIILHDCDGTALTLYLAPGLVFGLVFGLVLHRAGRLAPIGAAAFALMAWVVNFLAVMIAVEVFQIAEDSFGRSEIPAEAAAGLLAGAVGGGLFGRLAAILMPELRWGRFLATGAGLGLLLPLALDGALGWPGVFLFYILWQGGYATMLGRDWARAEAARS